MISLQQTLAEQLHEKNVTDKDWLELIQRLLDYGVLCRDESRIEAEIYDRFVHLEPLVDDFLALMGIRLNHVSDFQYVRLIPPGARVPGLDDETDTPFNGGLRTRLGQQEVAMILALRSEYDKALRDGKVDEGGCVSLSMEALTLGLKNLLGRNLPENMQERKQLFKRLRQLRLVRFSNDNDFTDADNWIKIRPMIVNLVSNDLIDQLLSASETMADNELITEPGSESEPSTKTNVHDDAAAEPQSKPSTFELPARQGGDEHSLFANQSEDD